METERMRAAFEMWWGNRFPADSFKRTGKSGAYDNVHINNAWIVWSAALTSSEGPERHYILFATADEARRASTILATYKPPAPTFEEPPAPTPKIRLATYLLALSPPDWDYDKVQRMAKEAMAFEEPLREARFKFTVEDIRQAKSQGRRFMAENLAGHLDEDVLLTIALNARLAAPPPTASFRTRCEDKLAEEGSVYRCTKEAGHDTHENGNWEWHGAEKLAGEQKPRIVNGHVLKECNCGECPVCEWGAGICVNCNAAEIELEKPCEKMPR